jgi:hypothetical protein
MRPNLAPLSRHKTRTTGLPARRDPPPGRGRRRAQMRRPGDNEAFSDSKCLLTLDSVPKFAVPYLWV